MKTTRLPFGLAVSIAFALALAGGQSAYAQTHPSTMQVPVTFYDFHSDRSNPEFEQPNDGKLRLGMVDSLLDADKKPRLGKTPYLNHGVRFWFRDWSKLSDGTYKMQAEKDPQNTSRGYLDKFRPLYRYRGKDQNECCAAYIVNPPGVRGMVYGDNAVPFDVWYTPTNWGGNKEFSPMVMWIENQYGSGGAIDTAFSNRVVHESLRFDLIDDNKGVYQFQRDGSAGFFADAVNGKGFNPTAGNNWIYSGIRQDNRNFSYTMELVWTFSYDPTITQDFAFFGDDDVWVFIKDKLVMDLGGIHQQQGGSFNLKGLVDRGVLNLAPEEPTEMRLFYSERHADAANIQITTNIITYTPDRIFIKVVGDELTAGVPALGDGRVTDKFGVALPADEIAKGEFTWSAYDITNGRPPTSPPPNGNASVGRLDNPNVNLRVYSKNSNYDIKKADSIYLVANKAYTTIRLIGTFCNQAGCVTDSQDVQVRPGPAAKLTIEASQDSLVSLRDSRPLDTIRLNASQTTVEGFYAILRDAYGNWVSPASGAKTWTVGSTAVATVVTGTNAGRGQGRATRVSSASENTWVTVASAGLTSIQGETTIKLSNITYDNIRIGVKVGGTLIYNIPGDSIRVFIPGDTTLYVELLRSDTKTWVEAPADWLAVAISGTAPAALPGSPSYNYNPQAPAEIRLIARVPGNAAIADTIRIRALYNDAASMRFFNKTGVPANLNDVLTSYPPAATDTRVCRYPVPTDPTPAITVVAGETLPIVAALFGTTTPAVNSYIQPPFPGTFTWTIVDNLDPSSTVVTPLATGYEAGFRSTVAHRTHVVRATYTYGTTTVVQDLRVQVIPGAVHAVYIEPENQDLARSSLNKPLTFSGVAPVLGADGVIMDVKDTLELARSETSRQVYALLRDKWGNYIAPSGGYYPYWSTYYGTLPTVTYTTWGPGAPASVIAEAGDNPEIGQGLVTKIGDAVGDQFFVTAKEETFLLSSVTPPNPYRLPVKILAYSYTELRVREKGVKIYGPNDTLKITTNDTPELIVEGRRSDCTLPPGQDESCWEEVTGNWGTDEGLAGSLQTPPPGSSWKLDPRRKGNGNIIVSRPGVDADGNPATISVSVPTDIKLGPPTSAEMVIVSAPTVAGKPITAEIRYYNRTGLMTEWDPSWTSTVDRAAFSDNQVPGKAYEISPDNFPKVGSKNLFIGSPTGVNAMLVPDPATGKAIVTFLLYNANDNPHTLSYAETIVIDGKAYPVSASANVTLLPGEPVRVVIVDGDGKEIPGDSLNIEHGDMVILQTVGEDAYGNKTGNEDSEWCIDPNAAIPQSGATCQGLKPILVYDSKDAEANGCGMLNADPDGVGGILGDSLKLCIINVTLKPQFAVTRDTSGSGYLNAVEVHFRVKVELDHPYIKANDNSKINLRYVGKTVETFTVNNVTIDSNVVTLWLDLNRTAELQTGWTPVLDISKGLIKEVGFSNQPVSDGAAPVIYTAKKYFDKGGDKKKDYIEVKFSEDVKSAKGELSASIAAQYKPSDLFQIWVLDNGLSKVRGKKLSKSAKASFVLDTNKYKLVLPDPLADIRAVDYGDASTLRFVLENGAEVGPPSHYINIVAVNSRSPRSELSDKITNVPYENNRKVQITFGEEPPERMIPVPNPASPDKSKVGNSDQAVNPQTGKPAGSDAYKYIGAYHNPGAIPHIKGGGGGAVFQVPVHIAINPATGKPYTIRCQVKVYDLAGNLVSSGEEKDILKVPGQDLAQDVSETGKHTEMHLFWSGFNSKGMKSAPGTYRIVVMISYPDGGRDAPKNKKFQGTVGIAK